MTTQIVSPQPVVSRKPVEIFISYSRADLVYLEELCKYLKVFRDLIKVWYDGNLKPGDEWEPVLLEQFHSAQIVLLLVSADFIASDYISKPLDIDQLLSMLRVWLYGRKIAQA